MPVEGSEPLGDDVHVGSVADAEHPEAARLADRLDDDREPVRLHELPNVLRGTADRGGHRADAPRGEVPAHPPLVQQQFHGGDGLAAEAERLVDPRRRQQPEFGQRHGRLERVRLVQRPDQWQEPVDVAVVEQQCLIDVGPVAAVILVRELGVNHVQAELPGLAHMLELAADDQDARPSGGDRRGPLAGGYDIVGQRGSLSGAVLGYGLVTRVAAAVRRATAAASGDGAGEPLARGLGDELGLALLGDETVGVRVGEHLWLLGEGSFCGVSRIGFTNHPHIGMACVSWAPDGYPPLYVYVLPARP